MKRVKSAQEMDGLIAIREVCCSFAKLNYGLMLFRKLRIGEDGNSTTGPISDYKESQVLGYWLIPNCIMMKTFISVGIFINPN